MLRLKGHFRGEDVELRPEDHAALRRAEANPESSFAKALELLGKPPAPTKQPPTLEEILQSIGPPPRIARTPALANQPTFLEVLQSVGPPPRVAPVRYPSFRPRPPDNPTPQQTAGPSKGPADAPASPTAPNPEAVATTDPTDTDRAPAAPATADPGPAATPTTRHAAPQPTEDPSKGPTAAPASPVAPNPGAAPADQHIVAPITKAPARAPDQRPRPHEPRMQGCRTKNTAARQKRTKKSGGTRQPCKDKGEGRRGTCFLNYPPRVAATKTPPRLTSRRQSTAPLHARPPDNTSRRLSARGADKPGRRSWRFVASKQRPTQQPKGHPHPPPPTPRRRRAWAPRLETRRPPTNHARPPDPVARQGGRREGALAAPPQHC
ncbi:proline-rich receptor-like protein kinase PERK2 [Leguminivora glycinivorella]|uniref:proline-rich receptor-like protein kinase PERK2 n=1 Tax=Leguminivora glycinivorella TaxID=1035111 RepID=UPI00200DB6A2|nr:proline-rich receptor-like protein kinase PERK2 [Leguminivora glycinivorella]